MTKCKMLCVLVHLRLNPGKGQVFYFFNFFIHYVPISKTFRSEKRRGVCFSQEFRIYGPKMTSKLHVRDYIHPLGGRLELNNILLLQGE